MNEMRYEPRKPLEIGEEYVNWLVNLKYEDIPSEVRERAATRCATVTLESVNGERGGGLRVTLRYDVLDEADACAPMATAGFSHMAQVAELCGLDLYSIFGDARPAEPGEREKLRDCTVVLEWLCDPTQLSTSDLKTRLRLIYND